MRGTVHLVTARDCRFLRPVLQPALERGFLNSALCAKDLGSAAWILPRAGGRAGAGRRAAAAPLAELGKQLQAQWPDRNADSLGQAIRALLPLVQVPPRGIWGEAGWRHAPPPNLARQAAARRSPLDELVLRYLAAFGPASVKDAQTWSGLKKLGDAVERAAPAAPHLPRRARPPSSSTCPMRRGPIPPRPRRPLPAGIGQPAPLPRRPHPRHRRGSPQTDLDRQRHHPRHDPDRRVCRRNLVDQAGEENRHAAHRSVRRAFACRSCGNRGRRGAIDVVRRSKSGFARDAVRPSPLIGMSPTLASCHFWFDSVLLCVTSIPRGMFPPPLTLVVVDRMAGIKSNPHRANR